MSIAYTGDAATTRTNLGLGDAATKTTGTAAGNIPVLDSSGKLPNAIVGALSLTTVQTAANQAAQLALTTEEGDVVVRSDENKTYVRNSGTASDMTDFTLLATPTDAVASVNGSTGTVTIDTDLVSDTTPQLGGNLDMNSNTIAGATETELGVLDMSASGSTSGQLLTSAGTGSVPTWSDAPQGVSNSKLFYFGSFN